MGTSISSRVPSLQAPTMVPHPQRAAGDHRSHLTNGPWAKWHAKPWVWAYHGRILGVLFLYHGVSMSFIYLIENMLSNPSFKIFRSPTSSSTFSIHRSVGPPICNPSIKLNMSQGCVLKTGDIYIYMSIGIYYIHLPTMSQWCPNNLVPATNTVQIYPNDLINFCFRDFEVHLITFDPQNRMIICVCVCVTS